MFMRKLKQIRVLNLFTARNCRDFVPVPLDTLMNRLFFFLVPHLGLLISTSRTATEAVNEHLVENLGLQTQFTVFLKFISVSRKFSFVLEGGVSIFNLRDSISSFEDQKNKFCAEKLVVVLFLSRQTRFVPRPKSIFFLYYPPQDLVWIFFSCLVSFVVMASVFAGVLGVRSRCLTPGFSLICSF